MSKSFQYTKINNREATVVEIVTSDNPKIVTIETLEGEKGKIQFDIDRITVELTAKISDLDSRIAELRSMGLKKAIEI